jgi:hypothetical protein
MSRINQRLNGINPLAYLGVDAYEPNDFIKQPRDPLPTDFNNFYLGTWWLNTVNNGLFYLAALDNSSATWINISEMSGAIEFLTGDTGGEVPPTAGNINIVGDGSTVDVVGNPATHTLTITTLGSAAVDTLTGNSGGAVPPTDSNINIIGVSPLSVSGNPATSTLTITQNGTIATSFNTQLGTATPSAGALTISGSNGLATSGSGSTVTVDSTGVLSQSFITSPATGTAVPAAGVLTFAGTAGVTVSASGSTITISSNGSTPTYSTGSFTPVLSYNGSTAGIVCSRLFGQYVQIGNFVSVIIDIAITTYAPSAPGSDVNAVITGLPFTPINALASSPQMKITGPVSNFLYSTPTQIFYWFVQYIPRASATQPIPAAFPRGASASISNPFMRLNLQNGTAFTVTGCYLI